MTQKAKERELQGDTKVRVLAVATYAEIGGAEILLCEMLAGVMHSGINVTLLTFGDGPIAHRARELGLTVIVAPRVRMSRPLLVLHGVRRLRATIRESQPTVIHASNPKAQLLARITSLRPTIPCTTQLLDPPMPGDRFARATKRLRGPRFAITAAAAEGWAHVVSGNRIHLITPGIDVQAQAAKALLGDANRVWSDSGFPDAECHHRVVMVARLQRYKGQFDFLDAVEIVREKFAIRALIIGPDEPLEPGLRNELASEIARRNLGDVARLAGTLSTNDVAAVIANATLLVHPAHNETFGLVILEAIATGTPVVAYATAGPAEILQYGGGALVPVGDHYQLANLICSGLADPEVLAKWQDEALVASHRFTADAMIERYVSVFRATSQSRPPGGSQ